MDEALTKRSSAKPLARWAIVIAILIVPLFCIFSFLSHLFFLCQSEETIRAKLLEETPVGSTMEEVAQYLERKGWRRDTGHQEHLGFVKHYMVPGHGFEVIGSKSFEVELGSYTITLVFRTYVKAYWGFDDDGRLIEVWVEKQVGGGT